MGCFDLEVTSLYDAKMRFLCQCTMSLFLGEFVG